MLRPNCAGGHGRPAPLGSGGHKRPPPGGLHCYSLPALRYGRPFLVLSPAVHNWLWSRCKGVTCECWRRRSTFRPDWLQCAGCANDGYIDNKYEAGQVHSPTIKAARYRPPSKPSFISGLPALRSVSTVPSSEHAAEGAGSIAESGSASSSTQQSVPSTTDCAGRASVWPPPGFSHVQPHP